LLTAPTDTEHDTAVMPDVAFSFEYVTLIKVRYGNGEWMIPVRLFAEASGVDLHATLSNPDGSNATTHCMPGGASPCREMLLPRALATAAGD